MKNSKGESLQSIKENSFQVSWNQKHLVEISKVIDQNETGRSIIGQFPVTTFRQYKFGQNVGFRVS